VARRTTGPVERTSSDLLIPDTSALGITLEPVSDARSQVRTELAALIRRGDLLQLTLMGRAPAEARQQAADLLDPGGKGKAARAKKSTKAGSSTSAAAKKDDPLDELVVAMKADFGREYQAWYSQSLPVVEQLLPDRYVEFRELHRLAKPPKELDPSTYTINDYLQGVKVTNSFTREEAFSSWHVTHSKLQIQIDIVRSAEARLDSALSEITGVIEAGIFDDELAAARELLKAKHLRSAGVIAGVVLERHLKRVLATHGVKSPRTQQIGKLNDALKEAKVYDVPQWRQIQRLGDIRNLCAHDNERDPTEDEVAELVDSVAKVVSTIF
jgi:HEPN domain-containing protein